MKNTISINYNNFFLRIDTPFHAFISLGKNFIELAITNTEHTKIEVVKTFTRSTGNITQAEATEVFQLKEITQAEKVFIGLESNKFSLIPDDLFLSNEAKTYLNATYELNGTETCNAQKIHPLHCTVVYSLKQGTENLIKKELKNATTLHAPSALLETYPALIPPGNAAKCFIRLNSQEVLVTIYKNKELQLHQSYPIEHIDDALYYYLNALRTLGYDQQESSASLHGNHNALGEFEKILKQNILSVKYITRIPNLEYTEGIYEHASHDFFNLFALVQCA